MWRWIEPSFAISIDVDKMGGRVLALASAYIPPKWGDRMSNALKLLFV